MFYDIKKLDKLDEQISENLASADNHSWTDDYRTHWLNYRTDMPNCLMVIREYKEVLRQLELKEEK